MPVCQISHGWDHQSGIILLIKEHDLARCKRKCANATRIQLIRVRLRGTGASAAAKGGLHLGVSMWDQSVKSPLGEGYAAHPGQQGSLSEEPSYTELHQGIRELTAEALDIDDFDTAEALAALGKALEVNPEPQEDPDVLSLEQLRTVESVFQPRGLSYREGEHEAHVDVLAKAIGKPDKPKYLEAITVWWGGTAWYILDGHHRRLAYERANVVSDIPVRVFKGSLDDALKESVSLNSKNKMPMSLQDKMNAAWKLTAQAGESKSKVALSKSEVALACSIGESSVANMRRTKSALAALGTTTEQMLEMNWAEAQRVAKGEAKPQIDHDAETERRARGYVKSIAKALKDRPHKDPEGFAMALRMLDERLPVRLLETEAWADVRSSYLLGQEEFGDDDPDY